MFTQKKELVSELLNKIRLEGYQVLYRKYGKYLSEPAPVGNYEIDILAKKRNSYIIGICLEEADLLETDILEKIEYLATRTSKYSSKPVKLFIAVDQSLYIRLAQILQKLQSTVREQIRTFPMIETPAPNLFFNPMQIDRTPQPLFN